MNNEELENLAVYLESRLREIGEIEIADQRHYTIADKETGDEFLLNPRKRVILMLDAFDRSVQLLDANTYKTARARLEENVDGMNNVDVVVRRIDESERTRAPFRFDSLSERQVIRFAISALQESLLTDSEGPQ